ncbi:hypothetical protein NQ314_001650 [Rhamnusium bicolor]|uniref:ribonuclease III n=1 Tax=Rhamnusium bicolor TaxID=1586634 RepID=A0AAV8ZTK9_9CUCU|nr:hypothetical protein NQ314_001650 [Rhamnusium bicolor]
MSDDFTPRNYQVELMKIGLEKNTIIFLPTGSGKTFIALMILKHMSGSLLRAYTDGGKISVILVNTIALVEQHAKYILDHTSLNVGRYTDVNKVNLLIFDECHRGVNDHSMRQLMKTFENVTDPPRVLGLTATLLNGNCKPHKVMQEVTSLETTYHSKVATVDGLAAVVGYSTNPVENFVICRKHNPSLIETMAINILSKVMDIIKNIKIESAQLNLKGLKPLEPEIGYKKLANLIDDLAIHIESMGTYGGVKATLAHMIQCERLRRHCEDLCFHNLLSYVITNLSFVKELLKKAMKNVDEKDQIYQFSSDKVLQLLKIFQKYKNISKEELCCIIFTKRRFTAKIIFHILDSLRKIDPDYSHLKPDFMVGYNNNPYNDTRENLFRHKKNKEILQSFCNKETNVLVASNVLEEGVDIPKCTLVIKFDKPEDYRSYIQSKGRARHKDSIYYIIVDEPDAITFHEKYQEFQLVEQILNNYLIGKNMERPEPTQEEIERMYNEDELPPYYVNGPGSAQVNMRSAIPLLCQYCTSLPSDVYTVYTPEWYIKDKEVGLETLHCVVILLPTICPIRDMIEGEYMKTAKSAKRAAALKACILLHQKGELDDHLLPRERKVPEENLSKYIQGQILPNTLNFLHIIQLEPQFSRQSEDIHNSTIYDMYTSPLCFGIITPSSIPVLCDFPIYVSLGTINVSLKVNQKQIIFQEEDIKAMKEFHFLIFNDVLKVLQSFLIFDNSNQAEMLLVVPLNKLTLEVDFTIIKSQKHVNDVLELSSEEKSNLEVTQDTFLNKIVSPWYRRDSATYIVTEVCLCKNALTSFPNEDYSTFQQYFQEKHGIRILNTEQPLLLVKGLTKRLNYIKPKGKEAKRKRDKLYEEMSEYLIPELVVKQDFPASLWIQASFLPTILSRVSYMLQLEQLRCQLSKETGLGQELVSEQKPLELDEYLLDYEPHIEEEPANIIVPMSSVDDSDLSLPSTLLHYNKDYAAKMLEVEYPWKDLDEPKDIERDINVNLMDIDHYENFISKKVNHQDVLMRNESPTKTNKSRLALTYHKDFIEKSLKLLDAPFTNAGPELCEIYKALTTAKANDIVNLERLETLGDSFLKLIASVYIALRFPNYDEGRATTLKGRMVSNKNLYYLAKRKNLSGILKFSTLSPREEWLPPAFTVPEQMLMRIKLKQVSINALFNLEVSRNEQITGNLSQGTINKITEEECPPDEQEEESSFHSMAPFLKCQYIGDKHVADVVESLLGAFFQSCGFKGGIKFIEWIGIIPQSENIEGLLEQPAPDPVLDKNTSISKINFHLPYWQEIENTLGYHFKNRAYLLQALTHSSYTPNRITLSYEKLEFLGDAVLDFLITCYIYESCGNLNPGQLTDLRSALVNNNTFASLLVRCGFHKFLLMMNSLLQRHIDKFVEYLKSKNYEIDDEVLILLEEDELNLAEYVLGDVFEALAGAVYLDSGKDLNTVWKVFYKIMYKEIDLFSRNVPKNVIRKLFEFPGTHPEFGLMKLLINQIISIRY